jgi:hypothetical protein
VFHWLGETFDLPSGAIRIAESEGCENQAFQFGRSVIGLQSTSKQHRIRRGMLCQALPDELLPSEYIPDRIGVYRRCA